MIRVFLLLQVCSKFSSSSTSEWPYNKRTQPDRSSSPVSGTSSDGPTREQGERRCSLQLGKRITADAADGEWVLADGAGERTIADGGGLVTVWASLAGRSFRHGRLSEEGDRSLGRNDRTRGCRRSYRGAPSAQTSVCRWKCSRGGNLAWAWSLSSLRSPDGLRARLPFCSGWRWTVSTCSRCSSRRRRRA